MEDLSLFGYFVNCYKSNYFNFSGRARRREFWGFNFYYYSLGFVLWLVGLYVFSTFGSGSLLGAICIFLFGIYALLSIIPVYAVMVRRLHDVGMSGWWIFLSMLGAINEYIGIIVLLFFLYLFCKAGDSFENEYGESPKEEEL